MNFLDISPVIPVVIIDDPSKAIQVARALLAGGIGIIELTLRTPTAFECARAIADEVPDIALGIGTVISPRDVTAAVDAGANFIVSPGSSATVARAALDAGIPLLPGVSTVTEALTMLDSGYTDLKFFPAELSGGAPFLAALYSPLPMLRFCPTGGITATTAQTYLSLPNVGCVGGSWITQANSITTSDWASITRLARASVTRGGLAR